MKKPVPDPPSKIIHTPYLAVHADLSPQDALTYAEQLLHAIEAFLDEYCMANAGASGLDLLIGAAHAANSAQALLMHALERQTNAAPNVEMMQQEAHAKKFTN